MILIPVSSSPLAVKLLTAARALMYATPPPGTIPSSTAALVAFRASSILSFFSLVQFL